MVSLHSFSCIHIRVISRSHNIHTSYRSLHCALRLTTYSLQCAASRQYKVVQIHPVLVPEFLVQHGKFHARVYDIVDCVDHVLLALVRAVRAIVLDQQLARGRVNPRSLRCDEPGAFQLIVREQIFWTRTSSGNARTRAALFSGDKRLLWLRLKRSVLNPWHAYKW